MAQFFRHSKVILVVVFAVISSVCAFAAMHLKSSDGVSLSLFELPENLPYLYCEFSSLPEVREGRVVLFVFWQNGKPHRISGTSGSAADGGWDLRAYTPDAQQFLDRASQLHARKVRIIPPPTERDFEGRILASDAGLISRLSHAPNIPLYFRAELEKTDGGERTEYEMKFDLLNAEPIIPAAWRGALRPIKIREFPLIRGGAYARLASNLALLELLPQFQTFVSKYAKDKKMSSSLLSMRGELYAAAGSGGALWDGISVPAALFRFHISDKVRRRALYDFIRGLSERKYELTASKTGLYADAPTSLWLSMPADGILETGIINSRSIANADDGTDLPAPPAEAILWLSFSPSRLAEAVNSFMLQIDPDLDCDEILRTLNMIDNFTLTLNSLKSGTIEWKLPRCSLTGFQMAYGPLAEPQ